MTPANLGAILRSYRVRRGLSQAAVAKACKVSASHLSRIESGKTDITHSLLVDYCNTVGVVPHIRFSAPADMADQ